MTEGKKDMDDEYYNPDLCPSCSSSECFTLSEDPERTIRHCPDCDLDFVLWYDEPYDQMPIEVTDTDMNTLPVEL